MLSIRLTRTGKAHTPHYRIIVQEKRSKLGGKAVDYIGHYHPADKDKLLVIDKDKALKWLAAGAQPSDTVTNLMVKQGILDKSRTVHHFYTPTKKEAAPAVAPVAEEVAETPAEEPAAEVAEETPVAETTPEEAA
jgi:small subunit ribosomal protein S16